MRESLEYATGWVKEVEQVARDRVGSSSIDNETIRDLCVVRTTYNTQIDETGQLDLPIHSMGMEAERTKLSE